MTDDGITLDVGHEKIFCGKCYLVVVRQSSSYTMVNVIKLFKKLPQKILGDFFMIMIIYKFSTKRQRDVTSTG